MCTYVLARWSVTVGGLVRVDNSRQLGLLVRDRRRTLGMTQAAAAQAAGVSQRWLSSLEAGKPTAEIGLVFNTMHALGLAVDIQPAPEPTGVVDIDQILRDLGAPS
jgi:y4mF family transcriptional regulator